MEGRRRNAPAGQPTLSVRGLVRGVERGALASEGAKEFLSLRLALAWGWMKRGFVLLGWRGGIPARQRQHAETSTQESRATTEGQKGAP